MTAQGKKTDNKRSKVKISVLTKMLISVLLPLVIVLLVAGVRLSTIASGTVTELLGSTLDAETKRAANGVEMYFNEYYGMAQATAISKPIQNALAGWDSNTFAGSALQQETLSVLQDIQKSDSDLKHVWLMNYKNAEVLQSDGSYLTPEVFDATAREWYTQVVEKKQTILTSAYQDEATGDTIISVATPVYDAANNLSGIFGLDVTVDTLTRTLQTLTIGETGYITLFDTQHNVVFHPDSSLIMRNLDEIPYSDNMLQALNNNEAVQSVRYTRSDIPFYGTTTYIEDLGYLVLGILPEAEFDASVNATTRAVTLYFVGCIILLSIITIVQSKLMTRSVKELSEVAGRLADGELDVDVRIRGGDEISVLAQDIAAIVERLKTYILYIHEISDVLGEISEGNLRFTLQQTYDGEFAKIKHALLAVQSVMSETMQTILSAAEQVNCGAESVASGSQSHAQGATEQASSVEQLSASLAEISSEINLNTQSTADVDNEMRIAVAAIENSDEKMKNMLVAVNEITDHSVQIKKIIKEIEDIAFQTNILALNAAVEAARAGAAGKGFAVVADEVRNLASKTAEASKDTADLIEKSLSAIENGKRIADEAAESFHEVSDGVTRVAARASDIAENSEKQNLAIKQILIGVDQISTVVQSNAGISEQSAAASEELSGQARVLKHLVDKFQIADQPGSQGF